MGLIGRYIDNRIGLTPAMDCHPQKRNVLLKYLGKLLLLLAGWRLEGKLPEVPKFVAAAAPHTTNWDFVIALAVVFAFDLQISFMGKHTLFETPLGFFFRWFGGIPIDRTASSGVVDQIVEVVNAREKIILVLAPEGTRKKVKVWKTGFYHIAHAANIPILLCSLDYRNKRVGLGKVIHPSGDMDADLREIQQYFTDRSHDVSVI